MLEVADDLRRAPAKFENPDIKLCQLKYGYSSPMSRGNTLLVGVPYRGIDRCLCSQCLMFLTCDCFMPKKTFKANGKT